ncbi:MAG: folate-binding protein YgfZ [Gammaproteobacteria bacterium]|nr:folate-binding protein YgfZ [Gammaproteobacteria bacterium]MCW5583742.1 folate-binding protein YgfZ [Gammaproteobacteria bacterium]
MSYVLSDLGVIKLLGTEVKQFLQGQLTCDVESITASHSCMGAHCNPQGRVISFFYLFMFRESYYMLMQRSMIPIAITALKKYSIFYNIELIDASIETVVIGSMDASFAQDHPPTEYAVIPIYSNQPRHLFIYNLKTANTTWCPPITQPSQQHSNDWKRFNIMDRIPTIYPETSGQFLPHEINLDKLHAINFEKGCYTGQEIIARMHYRAKLKNHIYIATALGDIPPLPGSDIYSLHGDKIKACGIIVDAAYEEEHHKYHLLIMTNELETKHPHLFLDHDKKIKLIDIH